MKKLLLILLCMIFIISTVACGDNDQQDVSIEDKVVALNNFDSHLDLDTMTLHGVLGVAELNKDKEFIKTGEGSLKVTVVSNPYKTAQPYLFQATKLNKAQIDCTNFDKTEHITLQVYNSQSQSKRIGLQLVFNNSYNKGITEWFELKANGWTDVKYTILREYIPEVEISKTEKSNLVTGVNIVFDRPNENEVSYLDNMKLYKTDKAFTPVKMSLGVDEICSFDKLWQVYKLGFESYGGEELIPNVSYVKDNTSTGKGAALRIDTVPGTGASRWPGIVLNAEMLNLVDWASYSGDDRLCFDAYTPAINGVDKIYLNLYVNGNRYASLEGASLQRGEWITISYSVRELNGYSPSVSMDFSQVTEIKLFYLEHTGPSKVIYLDNFRMERAN